MLVSCSSELNCASCAMNSVFDCGLVGSWFCSCTTSSLRNESLPIPIFFSDDSLEVVWLAGDSADGTESTAMLFLSVRPAANELLDCEFVEPLHLLAPYCRRMTAQGAFT